MVTFIRIAFSGKGFIGTQKQPNGRTIQGVFEELLGRLYACKMKVTISSRLDRGVNANDFGLSFLTPDERVSPDHLAYYLRRALDRDIVVKEVRTIDDDEFSARYCCDYKQYLYLIQNVRNPNPLFESFTYSPEIELLDEQMVKEALFCFKGTHDFRQFATPEGDENTILTIDDVSFERKDSLLYLRFKGRNFLRYQVRFMVGAVLSHCQGKLSVEEIQQLLDGKEIPFPKLKAEPQGLMLEHIHYPVFPEKSDENRFVL